MTRVTHLFLVVVVVIISGAISCDGLSAQESEIRSHISQLPKLNYVWNYDWGPPQYVSLQGFTYNNSQAMEPFISRDGKWFFWNTRNEGDNVTLHYGSFQSPTLINYLHSIGGQANGPVPHLDAVPSMDQNYNFYWVSNRDYPQNTNNLETGIFDPTTGSVPLAHHVVGTFYHNNSDCCWITMDQEINVDGTLLFYVNAFFPYPPGPIPTFSNISVAVRGSDGTTWVEHPKAVEIMATINSVVSPQNLRYGPSSMGPDSLQLYFTVRTDDYYVSGLFVANRTGKDQPFGQPERIFIQNNNIPNTFMEPEAPTLTPDGNWLLFSRLDCEYKSTCQYVNIYAMQKNVTHHTFQNYSTLIGSPFR